MRRREWLSIVVSLICSNSRVPDPFHLAPVFDVATSHALIPESDIPEYYRNVDRLDQVLSNIESYIHFAFAVLKREEVVERMFTMVS